MQALRFFNFQLASTVELVKDEKYFLLDLKRC